MKSPHDGEGAIATGGSSSRSTEHGTGATDAQERVPPEHSMVTGGLHKACVRLAHMVATSCGQSMYPSPSSKVYHLTPKT